MIGAAELALLPQDAVRGEHGPRHEPGHRRALRRATLRPPRRRRARRASPSSRRSTRRPSCCSAYRAHEPWLEGRLIVTPHSAYLSPEAHRDIRIKSAETMRAALFTNRPQNVITPEMY